MGRWTCSIEVYSKIMQLTHRADRSGLDQAGQAKGRYDLQEMSRIWIGRPAGHQQDLAGRPARNGIEEDLAG